MTTPNSKQMNIADVSQATKIALAPEIEATAGKSEYVPQTVNPELPNPGDDSKKRKRHEGETPEEKVERKRKKKERKEKKEKRKSKKDDSGEDE